jgi:hypothetical protein
MAGKKPAKVNSATQKEKVPATYGKAVKYLSLIRGCNPFVCPTCNRNLFKGIIYEHDSKTYCKRTCIPKVEA